MGAPRLRLLIFALLSIMGFTLVVIPVGPAVSQEAPAEPAAGDEASVDLLLHSARPERLEITTGTTVTWTNKEILDYPLISGRHEIQADDGSFASPSMAPGTRWSRRFNLPGEYVYRCTNHENVVGQVVVTGPPILEKLFEEVAITENSPDDPTTWSFTPPDLIVTTGMSVIWRNNGTNVHTVTSDDGLFDSGDIAPGTTWKFKFEEAGAFVYHCTPHPWMTASVRVVDPGEAPPPPPPPAAPVDTTVSTRPPREAVPRGDQRGPLRHEVDIIEPNPANPNSWTFDPANLDLWVGDTVVWRNTGRMEHSVTAADGTFDSGLLAPGATWSRTFSEPAFVNYRCTPHPWMTGILRVAALTGPPPAPPASRTASGVSVALTPPPAPARQGSGPVTHTVDIVEPSLSDAMSWAFNPKMLDVRAGDTVVWRNVGAMTHTVTGELFDASLDPGETFMRRFDDVGVYAYACTPHPWMKGVVRVADAEGGAVPAVPSDVEIGSGGGEGKSAAAGIVNALPLPRLPSGSLGTSAKLGWALLAAAGIVGLTVLSGWRAPAVSRPD